jgi:GNAT superfamily N-acetyltransferase
MHKITYRKATKEDEGILFDLSVKFSEYNANLSGKREEFFYENWEEGFKEEIRESIQDENSFVYLALVEGEPAGYVYSRCCKECYYYSIDELFVDEKFRGMRIGESLLQQALDYGKTVDLPLRMEVFAWNKPAIDFYLKKGFKIDSYVLTY